MANNTLKAPPILHVSAWQLGVLLLIAGLIWLAPRGSVLSAQSFLAGGLIAVVPHAWFTASVFRHRGAQSARLMVRKAYVGEVGKFMFSMAGFAALFILMPQVNAPMVFAAFVLMLVIQVLGTARVIRRHTS